MTMMVHDQSSDPQSSPMLGSKRKADDEASGDDGADTSKSLKKSKHCRASKAKWTQEEDEILTRAVMMSGEGNWKKIAQSLNDRSHLQCLHRWQKVLNPALVKGPWKEEEDAKLTELVEKYGPKDWSTIAAHIPGRIGKQCRERWFNHLSPDVRKTNWTPDEDRIIIEAHSKIGNKWTNISKLLEGRPANAIKNHWNSTLLKRIQDSTGEPTPRRDRNRNKKPAPMRATEFDFRMQMQNQQFEDSCDSSPQQYQHSPSSSPETVHQDPQSMANIVRFQPFPSEVISHVFFNPFSDHHNLITPPAPGMLGTAGACATWDTWPAPNVIHLNPPTAAPSAVSSHPSIQPIPSTVANSPKVNAAGSYISHPSITTFNNMNQHANNISINPAVGQNMLSMMDAYASEFGMGQTVEPAGTQEYFMELYNNAAATQNASLPVELQYCFEPQQQAQLAASVPMQMETGGFPLSAVDSLGMNINHMNMANALGASGLGGLGMGLGMGLNMGMLNLEAPGFCPLDL